MNEQYPYNNLSKSQGSHHEHEYHKYVLFREVPADELSNIEIVDREVIENQGINIEEEMKNLLAGLEASGELRIVESTDYTEHPVFPSVTYALHFVYEEKYAHPISHYSYESGIGLHKKVLKTFVCDKCGSEYSWLKPMSFSGTESSACHIINAEGKGFGVCYNGTFHLKESSNTPPDKTVDTEYLKKLPLLRLFEKHGIICNSLKQGELYLVEEVADFADTERELLAAGATKEYIDRYRRVRVYDKDSLDLLFEGSVFEHFCLPDEDVDVAMLRYVEKYAEDEEDIKY